MPWRATSLSVSRQRLLFAGVQLRVPARAPLQFRSSLALETVQDRLSRWGCKLPGAPSATLQRRPAANANATLAVRATIPIRRRLRTSRGPMLMAVVSSCAPVNAHRPDRRQWLAARDAITDAAIDDTHCPADVALATTIFSRDAVLLRGARLAAGCRAASSPVCPASRPPALSANVCCCSLVQARSPSVAPDFTSPEATMDSGAVTSASCLMTSALAASISAPEAVTSACGLRLCALARTEPGQSAVSWRRSSTMCIGVYLCALADQHTAHHPCRRGVNDDNAIRSDSRPMSATATRGDSAKCGKSER